MEAADKTAMKTGGASELPTPTLPWQLSWSVMPESQNAVWNAWITLQALRSYILLLLIAEKANLPHPSLVFLQARNGPQDQGQVHTVQVPTLG